jgi:hypothetical protein
LLDLATDPRHTQPIRIMRQHHLAVARQVRVGFKGIGPQL